MQTNLQTKNYRWIPVIASFAIQLCMGIAYIWSVFQSYLIITPSTPKALFSWDPAYGTLAYALLLGLLAVGSLIGGRIQDKLKNPRLVVIVGGAIVGLGFFFAQFTTQSTPWLLWIMYGVLGGIGMGMAYTTTIAACQKWFPDKKGMVTGIIVSALGFGGLVFTPLTEALIKRNNGNDVLSTFAIIGVIFIVVTVIGAIFIKNPPEGYKPEGWTPPAPKDGVIAQSFSPAEVLKTPQFYMVTLAFMCATAAGSMMIPMSKILGLQPGSGLTAEAAVSSVMIIAAFNSFGRIFWGWVSDKIGRRNTLMTLLVVTAAAIMCVAFTNGYIMLILIGIIGFSYGGYLGVFPALSADFWGAKNAAQNYGMVLFGFGIGAVASSYIGAYFSKIKAFSTAFLIAGIVAIIGFAIILLLRAPKQKAAE